MVIRNIIAAFTVVMVILVAMFAARLHLQDLFGPMLV
jgi:hypothetical protein